MSAPRRAFDWLAALVWSELGLLVLLVALLGVFAGRARCAP